MQLFEVLAYYYFAKLEDPQLEVARHREFLEGKDIRCRVYISEEGINGQMSASREASQLYQEWLKGDPRFEGVIFKVHHHTEHAFPRTIVKYRKQLVAMDVPIDMHLTGEHVSPDRWKEMIEQRDENTLILDIRNDYEWEIGPFRRGRTSEALETFREFSNSASILKEQRDLKETKVMMYCTGGIRCELHFALLKQEGFENVFPIRWRDH